MHLEVFLASFHAWEGASEGAWGLSLAQDCQGTEAREVPLLAQGHRDRKRQSCSLTQDGLMPILGLIYYTQMPPKCQHSKTTQLNLILKIGLCSAPISILYQKIVQLKVQAGVGET